jgi:hypothetical protein
MAANTYKTLADEVAEYADQAVAHFDAAGFKVKIEPDVLGFPYTPTLVLRRAPTTILLEVTAKIQIQRVDEWIRYAKSSGNDTRIALCVPHTTAVTPEDDAKLRERRVGLYVARPDGLAEQIVPADLALNVQLPVLASQPARVRQLLGPAYDQFNRTQWREGFEDACQVIETEARRYLRKWTKTGRIKVLQRGMPQTLTARQINKMTLGQLTNTFSRIQAKTHADNSIQKLLASINKDRVAVVHHKKKAWTERRLRSNVGQHMWKIVAALKSLL